VAECQLDVGVWEIQYNKELVFAIPIKQQLLASENTTRTDFDDSLVLVVSVNEEKLVLVLTELLLEVQLEVSHRVRTLSCDIE